MDTSTSLSDIVQFALADGKKIDLHVFQDLLTMYNLLLNSFRYLQIRNAC
jgi:hypothetical protein